MKTKADIKAGERDFDDLMVLTSHQKAKHFKCDKCGRRLNTAGGLSGILHQDMVLERLVADNWASAHEPST